MDINPIDPVLPIIPIIPPVDPIIPVSEILGECSGFFGFLPIRKKESKKNFQLKGNYYNWTFDIIKAPKERLLPFFSQFFKANFNTITEFKIYGHCKNNISKCKTHSKLVANRISERDLDIANIIKKKDATNLVDRWYSLSNLEIIPELDAGIYELYFSDGINEFESELFCVDGNSYGEPKMNFRFDSTNFKWDTTIETFDNQT